MKIKELALLVGGAVEGDDGSDIEGASGIDTAKKSDIVFAVDERRLSQAENSQASCILTIQSIRKSQKPIIRVEDPKLSFLLIYNALLKKTLTGAFIDPSASIAPSARLSKNVWIGPHVTIEDNVVIGDSTIIDGNTFIKKNCEIGDFCHIYPNVTLYDNTILKNHVILHSGAVVGSDGFGYVKNKGMILKFPQIGKVIIEENVEIGANTTIDRGSLDNTVIGANSKIDNLCQIAHNVKIGKNMLMAGQTGVSGSTIIKDNVTMGGQVGIADNVVIGNNVMIGAQSGIFGKIKDNAVIWGTPARPLHDTKRQIAVVAWITKNFKLLSKEMKE